MVPVCVACHLPLWGVSLFVFVSDNSCHQIQLNTSVSTPETFGDYIFAISFETSNQKEQKRCILMISLMYLLMFYVARFLLPRYILT